MTPPGDASGGPASEARVVLTDAQLQQAIERLRARTAADYRPRPSPTAAEELLQLLEDEQARRWAVLT